MEGNLLDKIKRGNNRIKNLNISSFEGITGIGTLSTEDIRRFLCSAQELIIGYLPSDKVKEAYGKAVKKYNGTSLRYRKVNPLPKEQDIIKEYYRPIPTNLDEETIVYELAKIAFWANKVTKMICLPAKRIVKSNLSPERFMDLQQYYEKIQDGDFDAERSLYEEDKEFMERFYEYSNVMMAEKINYFIKTICISAMYFYLVKDNYTKFKTWGMYRDNNGKLVFAIDFPRRSGWHFSISFRR